VTKKIKLSSRNLHEHIKDSYLFATLRRELKKKFIRRAREAKTKGWIRRFCFQKVKIRSASLFFVVPEQLKKQIKVPFGLARERSINLPTSYVYCLYASGQLICPLRVLLLGSFFLNSPVQRQKEPTPFNDELPPRYRSQSPELCRDESRNVS
jgi:hypothetical protein